MVACLWDGIILTKKEHNTMPYIKKNDRKRFKPYISQVVDFLATKDDMEKVACIFWITNNLQRELRGKGIAENKVLPISENNVNKLHSLVFGICIIINPKQECFAGDINYVLSAIVWKVIDDSNARYYLRSLIAECISTVRDKIKPKREIDLLIRGAMGDMLMELYRRKTATYEDQKIAENGDL